MPVRNAEIADLFDRMAALLEIQGANPFRVRAYRNTAQTLGGLPRSVSDMLANKEDLSRRCRGMRRKNDDTSSPMWRR